MKYYLIIRLFERKKQCKRTVAARAARLKALEGFEEGKEGGKNQV